MANYTVYLDNTTNVVTPSGYIRASDLSVGDVIFDKHGIKRTVLDIESFGKIKAEHFLLSDRNVVVLPENNTFLATIGTTKSNRHKKIMSVGEIRDRVSNYKTTGSGRVIRDIIIELCDPIEFGSSELYLKPYALGAIIGDGSISGKNMTFTNCEADVIQKLQDNLPNGCELRTSDGVRYYITDSNIIDGKRAIRLFFENNGLFGHKSTTKFIPPEYIMSSIEQRTQLLTGLMDTDGEVSRGSYVYSTTSETLAHNVKFIVQSLGGKCTVQKYTRKDSKYSDFFILNIKMKRYMMIHSSAKHTKEYHESRYSTSRHIFEYLGVDTVECTKITTDSNSVLLDNFVALEVYNE